MKFGRKSELKVEVNPKAMGDFVHGQNTLTIPSDLTVEFEITRRFISSSQTGTFRIYNLGEKTRSLIQKDFYALTEFRAIQFRAGYEGSPLSLVFNGYVKHATSYRRGTEMITEIEAYDGGLAMINGFTAQTIAQGISVRQLLINLAKSLPGIKEEPVVGHFPAKNLRAKTLNGNTWSIILQESGNLATIDNGQVKILNLNEALEAEIPVISSETGLLGSPRRTPTKVEFRMLFEPHLTIGQLIELQSTTNPLYSGTYKVTGFTHRGIISPSVNGECVSDVSLFFGMDELERVQGYNYAAGWRLVPGGKS